MHHTISLITTIAASFGVASIFGFIVEKCKVPALVGYLLAGVVGSVTFGMVADVFKLKKKVVVNDKYR